MVRARGRERSLTEEEQRVGELHVSMRHAVRMQVREACAQLRAWLGVRVRVRVRVRARVRVRVRGQG